MVSAFWNSKVWIFPSGFCGWRDFGGGLLNLIYSVATTLFLGESDCGFSFFLDCFVVSNVNSINFYVVVGFGDGLLLILNRSFCFLVQLEL